MGRFDGKVAIVTGGSSGIGEAIARRFVAEGGKVAIASVDEEGNSRVQKDLGSAALGVVCDVSDAAQVSSMVELVVGYFGHVDVLFNNAGVIGRTPFLEMPIEELDINYQVNVRGAALVGQAVARAMVAADRGGIIVNTASVNGVAVAKGIPAYCATKGAVVMLTKAMAYDLASFGIRVNAFAPTATNTPMTVGLRSNQEATAAFAAKLNPGRLAEPEEMAAAALFLASDDASFVSGTTLMVDGGLTSHV